MTIPEPPVRIFTVPASSRVSAVHRGQVVVSGSYGGEYNAYHAGKWGLRGVILNDAGVGKDDAGICGLPYLDRIGLAAATADVWSCHIADGADMLAHGVISHVNRAALRLGCRPGESVRASAGRMRLADPADGELPAIAGGKRYLVSDPAAGPKIICLDAAPMLVADDAGAIAVTGSHAALFDGKPDGVVNVDVFAIFFSDGGIGKDEAGVARLRELDERRIPAGAASVASAPIGDSRAILRQGILSRVNEAAAALGGRTGMTVRELVDQLAAAPGAPRIKH